MGFFLDLFTRKPKQDPYVDLVREMLASQQQQSQHQHELTLKLMDAQKDQNETTRMLLQQYVAVGVNESSSLESRLFQREDNVEWDEIPENPFKGI